MLFIAICMNCGDIVYTMHIDIISTWRVYAIPFSFICCTCAHLEYMICYAANNIKLDRYRKVWLISAHVY